ncbi:hypothetical protein BOX15_Mlig016295g3 [Macrostomum lignano]|uniref:Uncharacterized protein n=1 Tax=Macrostomum lignano TaxID=282301 RepID=A0A267GCE1_9PLAT|nr:hypothetical protein BOX15_Mlig016295g5 [Macrostomum lignano]PAA93744.1 hypothetical protein BOX15_Mlig016295g3 [Macrostomum lignano]
MPNNKRSHEENRRCVCILCFRKGDRPLTATLEALIECHVLPGFADHRGFLPLSICNSCRIKLMSQSSPAPTPLPPKMPYEQVIADLRCLPPLTRERPDCNCWVCHVGSSRANKNVAVYHPFMPDESAAGIATPLGRPPNKAPGPMEDSVVKRCETCSSPVARGLRHQCGQAAKLRYLDALSPYSREHVACGLLREKLGVATSSGSLATASLTSGTGGRPLQVQVAGTSTTEIASVQHSTMRAVKTALNLSTSQTLRAAQVIREASGSKKAVQSGLKEFLFAEGQSVAKFFTAEQRQFFRKQPNGQECVIERSVVFCRDVYAFLAHVSNSRGTAEMHQRVKLAIDGGGNSLKVCVSVTVDGRGCTSSAQFNRFMDSGVKKILILALVEDVKECYQNVSVLMSTIDISSINFTLACDFKLANIISGIQSHSSSHPCLYCEGRPPWEVPAQRRTLGSIRHLASEFQAAGGHQPLAKNFANCVQPPLLPGSDSAELLDVVPPPELHMMLGIVNRLLDALNASWGGNKAYEWAYEAGICRQQYHGGCLEGPACKKLLLKASELWSVLPPHLKLYATALQDFNAVREACFGQSLAADYSLYIARFQTTCRYLELSVTPKMHALFDHVPAFCGKYGKGLGSFSEQAVESAHSDFEATWQRYKRPLNHPQYSTCLLQSIINYNSFHI